MDSLTTEQKYMLARKLHAQWKDILGSTSENVQLMPLYEMRIRAYLLGSSDLVAVVERTSLDTRTLPYVVREAVKGAKAGRNPEERHEHLVQLLQVAAHLNPNPEIEHLDRRRIEKAVAILNPYITPDQTRDGFRAHEGGYVLANDPLLDYKIVQRIYAHPSQRPTTFVEVPVGHLELNSEGLESHL